MQTTAGRSLSGMILLAALLSQCPASFAVSTDFAGDWDASLTTPGGPLPFVLQITREGDRWQAVVRNGPERIKVATSQSDSGVLTLDFPHFDAVISATRSGHRLTGTYRRRRSATEWAELPFAAIPAGTGAVPANVDLPQGRWKVAFSSSSDPSVAVFTTEPDGTHWATILTTLGDYRYLTCRKDGATGIQLAAFDGGHAFLLKGRLENDGSIHGDFWSGSHWHETWSAVPDDSAELPDALRLTSARESVSLDSLRVRTLAGDAVTLADKRYKGRARIISLFGSWCPNCHDAAAFLSELHDEYQSQGLSIVGVAFELTGEFQRDRDQVRRYIERFQVSYPVVVGGLADKAKASSSFPLLEAVKAYPTMVFLDENDRVTAVYTGFSGPATGAAHERLKGQLHDIVQRLLKPSSPQPAVR